MCIIFLMEWARNSSHLLKRLNGQQSCELDIRNSFLMVQIKKKTAREITMGYDNLGV